MGDVLISVDTAAREAEAQNMPLERRLAELMLHGLLHLAGYDHERSEVEAVVMWDKERCLLAQLEENARQFAMPSLSVNIGPIAALRDTAASGEPDSVLAAGICELAGAGGITAQLREDGSHDQERDLRLLRETVKTHLNLEMAASRDLLEIALDLRPDMVTLAPEHFRGPAGLKKQAAPLARALAEAGIEVALLVAPDDRQIATAAELGATHVQLNTGRYAEVPDAAGRERELALLRRAAELALEQGLRVRAGRGLNYRNVAHVAALPGVEALVIGQSLAARALFTGLDHATREMLAAIRGGVECKSHCFPHPEGG